MRLNNPSILITREIDKELLNAIISKGFALDIIPFIRTEILRSEKVKTEIEAALQQEITVVFTSVNAVEAISEYIIHKKPNWKIYCIGNTTKQLVENFFAKESIMATADDATALAEQITGNKQTSEVYFFCGNKKRNELPTLLKKNNINVNEIEVYTTTILQRKIEKEYDAVLFFSPSAAEGFFAGNVINKKTILFAIGNTTAGEIKKFSSNKILISDKSEKKALVEKMISFFDR